jgi:alkyl hydroperoxide reductase subunit AhpC
MAEPKQVKAPEISDVDATHKLLAIASASQGDPALRATHAAARNKLIEMNKVMQDQVDKQREEVAKAIAAEEAKAAEEATAAKRKAEDEAATSAKKAEAKPEQRAHAAHRKADVKRMAPKPTHRHK